jgi:hypothetical protein
MVISFDLDFVNGELMKFAHNSFIRDYKKGDNSDVLDCIKDNNKHWPSFDLDCSRPDHLDWKFLDNPIGPPLSCLVQENGQVISFNGSMLARVCIAGKRNLASQNVDMCTRQDFRGRGLMKQVVGFQQNEIEANNCLLTYGFPNSCSHHVLEKLGYHDLPGKMVQFQYIIDTNSFFEGSLAPIKTFGYEMYQRLKASLVIDKGNMIELDPATRFDERVDQLFNRAAKDFDMIFVRDHNYLNWRYVDPRSGNFIIRQFRKEDRLIGYIILKIIGKQCYIADLLVDPKHRSALDDILNDAKNVAFIQGANIIFCRLPHGHPYKNTFRRSGFMMLNNPEVMRRGSMIFFTSDENIREIVADDETKCHITFGDTDWV